MSYLARLYVAISLLALSCAPALESAPQETPRPPPPPPPPRNTEPAPPSAVRQPPHCALAAVEDLDIAGHDAVICAQQVTCDGVIRGAHLSAASDGSGHLVFQVEGYGDHWQLPLGVVSFSSGGAATLKLIPNRGSFAVVASAPGGAAHILRREGDEIIDYRVSRDATTWPRELVLRARQGLFAGDVALDADSLPRALIYGGPYAPALMKQHADGTWHHYTTPLSKVISARIAVDSSGRDLLAAWSATPAGQHIFMARGDELLMPDVLHHGHDLELEALNAAQVAPFPALMTFRGQVGHSSSAAHALMANDRGGLSHSTILPDRRGLTSDCPEELQVGELTRCHEYDATIAAPVTAASTSRAVWIAAHTLLRDHHIEISSQQAQAQQQHTAHPSQVQRRRLGESRSTRLMLTRFLPDEGVLELRMRETLLPFGEHAVDNLLLAVAGDVLRLAFDAGERRLVILDIAPSQLDLLETILPPAVVDIREAGQ